MIMKTDKKATIVGGGLAGTCTAYSLAKRGWSVTIIEREGALATQASGNQAGIFMPMITDIKDPVGLFYLEAFYYALQHFQTLSMVTKAIKWKQCGVLDMAARKVAKDPKKTVLSLELIAKVSEKLASNMAAIPIKKRAMYLPDSGYISPESICSANIKAYEGNIRIKYYSEAISLERKGIKSDWKIFNSEGEAIESSPVVVLANAYDIKTIEQSSWIPIEKVRGQVSYLPVRKTTENLQAVLCANGYMTPAINGFHSIGATFDKNDDCTYLRQEDHRKNINNFRQYIDIEDVNIDSIDGRVSFRSASPDHRPVVGKLANYKSFKKALQIKEAVNKSFLDGLYITTGHGSRGVVSTPIAGEYIASLINDEEKSPLSSQEQDLLSPSRFIKKEVKSC